MADTTPSRRFTFLGTDVSRCVSALTSWKQRNVSQFFEKELIMGAFVERNPFSAKTLHYSIEALVPEFANSPRNEAFLSPPIRFYIFKAHTLGEDNRPDSWWHYLVACSYGNLGESYQVFKYDYLGRNGSARVAPLSEGHQEGRMTHFVRAAVAPRAEADGHPYKPSRGA